jgi:hypothetical protein
MKGVAKAKELSMGGGSDQEFEWGRMKNLAPRRLCF